MLKAKLKNSENSEERSPDGKVARLNRKIEKEISWPRFEPGPTGEVKNVQKSQEILHI